MPRDLLLDSLTRRVEALHSLWRDAVATMGADHVNHVERAGVLPIAFSLFHFVHIEDFSASLLGAGPMVFDLGWADRMRLALADDGKHRTVEEMMAQRIGHYPAFVDYLEQVFAKTDTWLPTLGAADLVEVVVRTPYPPEVAATFSARVGEQRGITRLDAVECWIYQHGLRHMGEIEHARALVGLGGMTS